MKIDNKQNKGFILPIVIVIFAAISILSLVVLQVLATSSTILENTYYNQLATEAAKAGITQGSSCLADKKPDWNNQLTPDSHNQCRMGSTSAILNEGPGWSSTFVAKNESTANGPIVHSKGTVNVYGNKSNTGSPIHTYTKQLDSLLLQTGIKGAVTATINTSVTQVVSGGGHSCALASGAVYCWGVNVNGQLGKGSFVSSPTPEKVHGLDDKRVTEVEVGADHTCVIAQDKDVKDSNEVYCWGKNDRGQLGIGYTSGPVLLPTKVKGLDGKRVIKLAIGTNYSSPVCAITDETGTQPNIYCWGGDDFGAVGNGYRQAAVDRATRVYDPYGVFRSHKVVAAALNNEATCAVRDDGRVYCWGASTPNGGNCNWGINFFGDNRGYCEQRSYPTTSYIPTSYFSNDPVTYIAGGGASFCAIAGGRAYCWGGDADGVLGQGYDANSLRPHPVYTSSSSTYLPPNEAVTSIDVDSTTTCAIAAGKLYCWGNNHDGQNGLGYGGNYNNKPHQVTTSGFDKTVVTSVGTGNLHVCGAAGGKVYCWGKNNNPWNELLGDQSLNYSYTPHLVDNPVLHGDYLASSVSAGKNHTCSIINNNVFCWGDNSYGQLATGDKLSRSLPNQIHSLASEAAVMISSGDNFTCAVIRTSHDDVYCWGKGDKGQLGNNSYTNSQSNPVKVAGLPSNASITSISAGKEHACAVANSNVYCWGDNSYRQVKNSATSKYKKAYKVSSSKINSKTTKVAAGGYSTCAIADKELYCWGKNIQGIIGNGVTTVKTYGVTRVKKGAIGTNNVVDVTISTETHDPSAPPNSEVDGGSFACATLENDNSISCWGNNYYKQLASSLPSDYTPTPQNSNKSDLSGQSITEISAGGGHACAVSRNTNLICWGDSYNGALGNGASGSHTSTNPTRIDDQPPLSNRYVTDVSSSINHTCAIADSAIFCWGNNSHGQLGSGDHVNYSTPELVGKYGTLASIPELNGLIY